MVAPLFVGRAKSISALSDAMSKDKNIFLTTQKRVGIDDPGEKDINRVGTVGSVLQLLKLPDGTVKALIEGKVRANIVRFVTGADFFQVELEEFPQEDVSLSEGEALKRAVIQSFEK